MGKNEYLSGLKQMLEELYEVGSAGGICHDVDHVRRVAAFGPRIAEATGLPFDLHEFEVAAWLHNLDRIPAVQQTQLGILTGRHALRMVSLEGQLWKLLETSDFNAGSQQRIVTAVLQHSKFADEPGDSALLTALRIADKLDSLGPIGIVRSVSGRSNLPLYDPKRPFGYGSTVEDRMITVYDDFFRVLEWIGMLPSHEARSLINKRDLRANIDYLRALGHEIAHRLGIENLVEADISRALGSYYQTYAQ